MIMKRIIYSIVLTLVPLFAVVTSCDEKKIDIQPLALTEESWFTNEDEFEQAVFGVYQRVMRFHNFSQQNYLHDLWLMPDDNLTSNAGRYQNFEQFSSLNANNADVKTYWTYSYQLLNRAAMVLEKMEENADVYENQELRAYHEGEVRFLRGYGMFNLWNFFGNAAPIVDYRINESSELYPASATNNEMLDFAISEFQKAAELLPASWPAADLGRVTSGAANGMAGKALLFRATINNSDADYQASLAELSKIEGYSLVEDYNDNFSGNPEKENNTESLFEIQFINNSAGANPWVPGGNDNFAVIGELNGFWGYFDRAFNVDKISATVAFQQAVEEGDPRRELLFDPSDVTTISDVRKYVTEPERGNQPGDFGNARVLRYADVLLMKAEALIQSGGDLATAIGYINEIRTRARNMGETGTPADHPTTETDRNLVMQWLMNERRVELAFEESHRWFDLKRWHLGGIIDITTIDFSSARSDFEFQPHNLYYPVPESEISLNTNLVQNDGY